MSARALARGGALMLAATLLGNLALLGLDAWTNGLLGQEGYGAFGVLKRILQLGLFAGLLGMENATIRHVAISRGDAGMAVRRRAAWAAFLGSCAVAVAIVLGAEMLAAWVEGPAELAPGLRIGAAALPLGALRMVAVSAAQARGNMRVRAGVMFVVWPLAQLVGFAWLARGGADVRSASLVYVLAMGLGAALAWVGMLRVEVDPRAAPTDEGSASPEGHGLRDLLAFAWPGWVQGMAMAAYTWADQLLLAGLRSAEAAGVYGPVGTLAPLFGMGLQALSGPLAPRIAERHAAGDVAGMEAAYRSVTRWAVLLALPPVAVCVALPETVLACWPNGDASAASALRITALAQLFCTAVGSVNTLLIMAGRPRAALGNAIPALLINFSLSVALIPRWGVTGAALANAGAMIAANGLALAQVQRSLGVQPVDGALLRVGAAGALAGAACWGVRGWALPPLVVMGIAGGFAGAVMVLSYALLGPAEEDRELLGRAWARVRGRWT